jgi:signal transduction histidine kinase
MNTLPKEKKQTQVNQRLKIRFVFLLIFIPAYIAIFYWYYSFTVNHELEILSANLSRHVDDIITSLDVENFDTLYKQEAAKNENCPPKPQTPFEDTKNGYFPEDNPLFRKHMDWIKDIAILDVEQRVYTYVIGPEKDYVITVGSSQYFTNHDESLKFCQLYRAPNMYKGLFERVDLWTPYHDQYGDWITTHLPIKGKNGTMIGAIRVDVSASHIVDTQHDLLFGAAIMLLGTLLVSLGIAYNLTEIIFKPLGRWKNNAAIIDLSSYKIQRGRWRDETDILSEAVQGMLSRLSKQTEELKQSRAAMQDLAHGVIRAQESERKYISRELHSEVSQLLAILKTSLDDILLDLPNKDMEHPDNFNYSFSRERLTYAKEQIEKTLGVVRAISHKMRPSLLDVGDVNLALNDYCKEFSQRQKIEVVYDGFIIPNPSEEVAVSFYRFLQEALTNVTKHSSATKIWVRAQMDANWIQISVEDNGHGDQSTSAARGIGIAGLKERFFLLGGIVETRPVPGGFLVIARAPLIRV